MPNRDRKLAELAAISQLYGNINGPQVRQQEGQQQQALAILGLLLQQQHQAQQGTQAQQFHQDEVAGQGNALAETRRFHDAAIGQQASESTQRHGEVTDTNNARLKQEFIQHLMTDPSVSQEQKMAALSSVDPSFSKVGEAMHTAGVNSATVKAAPAFSAVYQAGAKDPKQLGPSIDALRTALPPEVFNNQDWNALNSSLPVASATSASGTGTFANQIPPALADQYNALPKAPGPLHWLTNPKPGNMQQAPPNLGPLNWLIDPGTPGYRPPQYDSVGSDLIKKLFGK